MYGPPVGGGVCPSHYVTVFLRGFIKFYGWVVRRKEGKGEWGREARRCVS